MSLLDQAFQDQVQTSIALGSPFMERLMTLLPGLLSAAPRLCEMMQSWPGDVSSRGASLPLRLAGGLNYLVRSGQVPELARCYPPSGETGLEAALTATLAQHESWLVEWIKLPPQTNEVGRSAVLIAAARFVMARMQVPLRLSELGASAGLNLNFDKYFLQFEDQKGSGAGTVCLESDWTGEDIPHHRLHVAERRGVDISPVNSAQDADRLIAYVWPDQIGRISRLQAALDLSGKHPVQVDQGDAAVWLERRLAENGDGQCHFVFHTIAYQYFPTESQERIRLAVEKAGAKATLRAPLAWFGMEADGTPHGAALTLRLWPGHEVWELGRAGFHGQWVDWRPKMVRVL